MDMTKKHALMQKERYTYADLLDILEILRSEDGCPWDREQTHASIRTCLIEETYEVVEAIDTANAVLLREELGDLLFQIVFHAEIEREAARFSMGDVVNDVCTKMIRRHPHVFGAAEAENAERVISNWESIKTEEKQRKTLADKLQAIPPMLPALMRAAKVAEKTGDAAAMENSILSDVVRTSLAGERADKPCGAEVALGELLYALAAWGRARGIDAEAALSAAVDCRIARETEKNDTV